MKIYFLPYEIFYAFGDATYYVFCAGGESDNKSSGMRCKRMRQFVSKTRQFIEGLLTDFKETKWGEVSKQESRCQNREKEG